MSPNFHVLIKKKFHLRYKRLEVITQINNSCLKISTSYYLPLRDDIVTKTIYDAIRGKDCSDMRTSIYIRTSLDIFQYAIMISQNQQLFTPLKTGRISR